MIIPHAPPPTLRPRKTISSDKDYEQLDRALKETEDQWVSDGTSTTLSSASIIESRISVAKSEVRPPRLAASFISDGNEAAGITILFSIYMNLGTFCADR